MRKLGVSDGLVECFEALVQSSRDAIVQAEASGEIIDRKAAATEVFGYEPEEVLGRFLRELFPGRYHEPVNRGVQTVSNGASSATVGEAIEIHGLRAEGTEFPALLTRRRDQHQLTSWGGEHVPACIAGSRQRDRTRGSVAL